MSVDNVDIEIVEQLTSDGRASLRSIAEEIDVSPSTASNRFRELRDNSVIEGFAPVLDYRKLGFQFNTVTQIKAETGKIDSIVSDLRAQDFVEQCFVVTGEADIIAISRFKNRSYLTESIKEVQKLEGVEDTRTNVILESYSENIGLNPLKD